MNGLNRRRRLLLGMVGAALLAAGCQAPGTERWVGTWEAGGRERTCEIRCVSHPVDDENWNAKFTAFCDQWYSYDVEMKGHKDGDTIRFVGDADLGKKYGVYHWTGQIVGDSFTGEYRSESGETGAFTMARK